MVINYILFPEDSQIWKTKRDHSTWVTGAGSVDIINSVVLVLTSVILEKTICIKALVCQKDRLEVLCLDYPVIDWGYYYERIM